VQLAKLPPEAVINVEERSEVRSSCLSGFRALDLGRRVEIWQSVTSGERYKRPPYEQGGRHLGVLCVDAAVRSVGHDAAHTAWIHCGRLAVALVA
jgi:hypothetical protein